MKKKYFNSNINSSLVLIQSKKISLFLIFSTVFLIGNISYAQEITEFTPTNACNDSNSSVVITGSGFTGATAVYFFNNIAATTYIVDSDNQITATLPIAATTGAIKVISSLGVSIISQTSFTVNQVSVAPTSLNGSPNTICNGSSSTLTQTGGSLGTEASWKWYSDAGFTTLVGTSNALDANLSVNPTSTTTYYLRAESTTGAPCTANVAAAGNVTIMVNTPVSINTQPTTQTVCSGTSASFSVTATGTDLTYQWYKGTFPGTAVTNTSSITGAQTNTLNFSPASLPDAGIYYVVISGASPCTPIKSNEITLDVDQPILITTQPVEKTICENASISFSVEANAGSDPITYQWRKNGFNISGAIAATYTITTAGLADAGNYDVVVSGASGYTCPAVTSNSVALTITPTVGTPTAITIAAGTEPSCQITASTPTTRYTTTATNSTDFNWSVSKSAAGSISSSGEMIWTAGFSGTVNIQVSANGCNGPSAQVIRTVTITPTVGTPTAITIAEGTEPSCQITASTPTTRYTTTATNSTDFNWSVSNSAAGSISSSGVMTWTAGFSGSVNIQVTANGCNGPSAQIIRTVIVNPTPNVMATNPTQTICSANAITTMVLSGNVASTTFNWTRNNTGTVTGINNSGTGNISGNLTNTTNTPITVTFTITPTANGCVGTPITATVTVDPTSVSGNLTGYATNQSGNPYNTPIVYSTNLIACLSTSGLLVLNGYTGNIIRWEYSANGGINWTPINHTGNSFAYSDIQETRIYRAVVQSGSCAITYSNIVSISVVPQDIKPSPVTASKTTMCLGETTVLTATSGYATGRTITGGLFNDGQLNTQDPKGWLVNGNPGGWSANADNSKPSIDWSGTNGPKTFAGITYDTYNNTKFGIVFGIVTSKLETPIFNTFGLATANLEFYQAYFLGAGSNIKVELSLDGGSSYPILLQNITGSASSGGFIGLNYTSFDLSNYVGQSQLRVRFTYTGATSNSSWALENFKLPTPPVGSDIVWTDEKGNEIGNTTTLSETPKSPGVYNYSVTSFINGCVYAVTPSNTVYLTVNVNFAYAGKDVTILPIDCGNNTVTLNAYDNTKTANQNIANGAYNNNYQPSDHPGTGATGKWTIKSTTSTCGTGSFSNDTDPRATFTGNAGTYVLSWTSGGCSDDIQITLTDCSNINFDGVNDNITFKDNYNLTSAFSIEVWVKPNSITGTQTIFSKRNANNLATGYDLKLVGSTISFNWNATGTMASPYAINTNRWYHIAVTFGSDTYRLYIDGIEVKNTTGVIPATNNFDCILGAMDQTGNPPNKPTYHFNGWIDELKVWNLALTPDQLHQMMNQEIKTSPTVAGNVQGVIIPIDINGLSWTSNLLGYYQMSSISCGYLNPTKGTIIGKLRNITTSEEQTAPIPYTSSVDGPWTSDNTWTNFSVCDYPNSIGIDNSTPIDWNIVKIAHNISSGNKDITVLGLISTTGKLTIADPTVTTPIENNDGQGLWITHYLKLNGTIDLVGESQLVQKRYTSTQFSESIFDASSLGYIERDQQGQQNSFNYNYWSSPVSTIQGLTNNTSYSISGILRDGTISSTPKTISFDNGAYYADTVISSPIKISNRWIWAYNSPILDSNTNWQNYYQWSPISSTGFLKTGEGFTMKGTGGPALNTSMQNYVFVGKPNSGDIILNLSPKQTYLIGNPYPCALDADKFIKDNLAQSAACPDCTATTNVFTGALYFWDHFGITNNHLLAEYTGGYATYTLTGGVKAIANDPLNINNGSTGSKIPEQYIPVAQGFFVDGVPEATSNPDDYKLKFKNSQRAFVRETSGNSIYIKASGAKKTTVNDTRSKIRLGFDSPTGMHRQLLVGADSNTTNLVDIGYDAPMFGVNADDMFWEINNIEFVIQSIPNFNADQIIPLGLIVSNEGKTTIKIDALENIPETTQIFLYDNLTSSYHNIKNEPFTTSLAKGEYKNRFSLRFTDKTLHLEKNNFNDGIHILYSTNYKDLIIQNKAIDIRVNEVSLFNVLGQSIASWDVRDRDQTMIQIPIKNASAGVYVVKLKTSKGVISKKIIIK